MKYNLSFLVFIICSSISFGGGWELAKSSDQIKIYTRQAEGSSIKEFKVIATTSAHITKLETQLEAVENFTEWQENVSSIKVIKTVSQNVKYIYTTSEISWPISDRDMVFKFEKTKETDGSIKFTSINTPSYISEDEDFLRIKNARGYWKFTPLPNGGTKIFYTFFGDPGGNLPDWVINMFIVDGPFETVKNLLKRVGG